MTSSPTRVRTVLLATLTGLATFAVAPASVQAATLKLACSGKGAKDRDSSRTVLCVADPGKRRSIAGTIRDDAGRPVAGKVTVVHSTWTRRRAAA
jgi:uncharacterized cupredoxin-like copper-binding protein